MTSRRAGLRSDEPGASDVEVGVDVALVGSAVEVRGDEVRGDVVPDVAVDDAADVPVGCAVDDRGDWAAAPGATSAIAIIKDNEAAMIRFTGPHTTHP